MGKLLKSDLINAKLMLRDDVYINVSVKSTWLNRTGFFDRKSIQEFYYKERNPAVIKYTLEDGFISLVIRAYKSFKLNEKTGLFVRLTSLTENVKLKGGGKLRYDFNPKKDVDDICGTIKIKIHGTKDCDMEDTFEIYTEPFKEFVYKFGFNLM